MDTTDVTTAPASSDAGRRGRLRARITSLLARASSAQQRQVDRWVLGIYLLGSLWVTAKLWLPHRLVDRGGTGDQIFFEWVLSHAQWALTTWSNPFFTDRLNAPDGVNMMANTSVLGLSIPLVPVTAFLGPGTAFNLMLVIGFAGTAWAWYWFLSRHVVQSRLAAFTGGVFCGFAPGMVSQGIGHPNFVAQFLLPVILWRVLKLREAGHAWRNGLILGLLVVYQVFINEETLLFTALACALFMTVYAVRHWSEVRDQVRPFFTGLGVAAGVAVVLLAYPLWFQFFGPQHYHQIPYGASYFSSSIDSIVGYGTESLAGRTSGAARLSPNASEEASFFGWVLVLLCGFVAWWERRQRIVLPLAVTGAVFAVLSLGPQLIVKGRPTGIPLPMSLLSHVPIFDMVVPSRLALPVIPILGLFLAVGVERVHTLLAQPGRGTMVVRWLWLAVVAGALVPIAPTPIKTTPAPAIPAFIADGQWRDYVRPGRTLVTVPLPQYESMTGMFWAAQCTQCFAIPRGYFVGPEGADHTGRVGAPPTPTTTMLAKAALTGVLPAVDDEDRRQAVADLIAWRADVVVLAPQPHEEELRTITEQLLGPGVEVGGVVIWDVSELAEDVGR